MPASASDIITYIGVPLAVLGVMPIIYTCIRALLVLRSIRHALARNGHSDSAVTRGSMMSGIVEVELPRCTITPLDRDHDPEYWQLNPERSSLKGGTWTFFNWNRLVTGKKLYRIQYKDELRVPQAEMEFHELVSFLLDRGAVPDEKGWSMLRTSGLWTPTGTVLLRPPEGKFGGVLRVGVPDDSDGVLSLKVHWSSEWDRRDKGYLPPFWMRIRQPGLRPATASSLGTTGCQSRNSIKTEENFGNDPTGRSDCVSATIAAPVQNISIESDVNKDNNIKPDAETVVPSLVALVDERRISLHGENKPSDSIRFRLEGNTLDCIYFEHSNSLTGMTREVGHLGEIVTQWFIYAASSLGQMDRSGTWNFVLTTDIFQATQRDAIPCGVMGLLSIMQAHEIPHWSSAKPDFNDPWKRHRRFMDTQRQKQLENAMPPAQAEAARRAREQATLWQMQDDYRESQTQMREYEEKRLTEAVNSTKLSNEIVAKACVAWLVAEKDIPPDYKITDVVRAALYLMVLDATWAKSITEICDRWVVWGKSGLNVSDITELRGNKISFCYAAATIYTMQIAAQSDGKLSTHMQECLDLWKKIRLG